MSTAELVNLAYAASLREDGWQAFCTALSRHTDEPTMLFGLGFTDGESLGMVAHGLDPAEMVRYHEVAHLNPWMAMNLRMSSGAVGTSDECLARKALRRTPFYNEWLRHQDDVLGGPFIMCHRTPHRFVGLASACRRRHIDATMPAAHELFTQLAPHLRRAIAVSELLGERSARSFAHLEANANPVIVVQRSGRAGFVNAAARALLARDEFITLSVARSEPRGLVEPARAFLRALRLALDSMDSTMLPAPVPLESASMRYLLHAHLLAEDIDHAFPVSAWSDPPVAVLVLAGGSREEAPQDVGPVLRAFGATAAETRLCTAVLKGESLPDYAERHRLSPHTVRNQMRSLLRKTDTRNQAALLALLLRLTSPLGPGSQPES